MTSRPVVLLARSAQLPALAEADAIICAAGKVAR